MAKVQTNNDSKQPFKNGITSKKLKTQVLSLEVMYLACTKEVPNVGTFTSHLAIVVYYCPIAMRLQQYQAITRLLFNGTDVTPLMDHPYQLGYSHLMLSEVEIFTYHRAKDNLAVDPSTSVGGFTIKPLKKAPVKLFEKTVTTHVNYSGISPDKITFKYLALEIGESNEYLYNHVLEVYVNDELVTGVGAETTSVAKEFVQFLIHRFYMAFEMVSSATCTPEAAAAAISAEQWAKDNKQGNK